MEKVTEAMAGAGFVSQLGSNVTSFSQGQEGGESEEDADGARVTIPISERSGSKASEPWVNGLVVRHQRSVVGS